MSNSRQIFQLRREKKYTEALLLAKETLRENPDDDFLKKACAWVLYDLCKLRIAEQDSEGLQELLQMYELVKQEDDEILGESFNRIRRQSGDQQMKIRALEQEGNLVEAFQLLKAETEKQAAGNRAAYEEQLVWLIWKNLKALGDKATQAIELVQSMCQTWQEVKELPRPHRAHSLVLQQLLKLPGKVREALPWREILEHWDLEHDFTESDWEPFITPDGKRMMPLAERVVYAYARSVLKSFPPATASEQLAAYHKLEALPDEHTTDFEWLPFFMGKLWLAAGQDPVAGRNLLLPFLRKKQHDFWSWSLLAETYSDEQQEMIAACLCRAMLCKVSPRFLQRVRMRLALSLSTMEKYPEAAREINRYLEIARKQDWAVQREIQDMIASNWYQQNQTQDKTNSRAFYEEMSRPTHDLFRGNGKQKWVSGAIEGVDLKGRWYFLRYSQDKSLRFSMDDVPDVTMAPGWCGQILIAGRGRQQKALAIKPGELAADNGFWRPFSGKFKPATKGDYGFAGKTFLPREIIQQYSLRAGEELSGWAVSSFDQKRQKYGWRALLVNEKK